MPDGAGEDEREETEEETEAKLPVCEDGLAQGFEYGKAMAFDEVAVEEIERHDQDERER